MNRLRKCLHRVPRAFVLLISASLLFASYGTLPRLIVDPRNPRHFLDTLGNPVLLVGDSPQNLPQKLTVAQMETYYADCESKGINLCWVCIDGQPTASPISAPPVDMKGNLEFTSGGTPSGWDVSHVNPVYFSQTIDSALILAENHGVYVNLMPMSQCYWSPSNISANIVQNCFNYGVWLGNRYKNQRNLLWIFGNDNIDTSRQCPIARGIVSAGDKHLMSVHALNAGVWGQDPLDDAAGASGNFYKHLTNSTMTWITYNSLYSDMQVFNQARFIYNEYMKADVMPIVMTEGPYQPLAGYGWQVATNMVSRSLNYRVAMGGGFGGAYTYGCDWLNSTTNPWNANLNKGARPHIKFFSDLFRNRPWWNLKPDWDRTFLVASSLAGASQQTNDNYTIAAYDTAHGALGLVYCTVAQTVTINMTMMSGPAMARWYDPTTGNYATVSGYPYSNIGSRQFTAPATAHNDTNVDNSHETSSDWVLVLENAVQVAGKADRREESMKRNPGVRLTAYSGGRLTIRDNSAAPMRVYDMRGRYLGTAGVTREPVVGRQMIGIK